MTAGFQRIYAILLRHFYVLRSSPLLVAELVYWPTIQMILWGFISQFFARQNAAPASLALGTLLGAVILWDFLFRTKLAVMMSFLEELNSRNMGHLFISPLRPCEWWTAMMLYSIIRALIGMVPAALMAIPFYGFSIFSLGLPMLFLFFNLMFMGWWMGFLVTALLLKVGRLAEGPAWGLTFLLAPFCAVYYPVAMLPAWLQGISHAIPASHVFEGLRALVLEGRVDARHILTAFALNCLYMLVSIFLLQLSFNNARKTGTLLQTGE